ncbi:uncharacterized protein LOC119085337 [Bradysia coprophila]|uniref:uncharacterized protein LOC119085337 n=1 Tax=Bradysia coprophila TaxID=38358 RepID=UPI00187DBDE3|nr:uncharacterized protein LOC119085337 [Bradysia coprophila]
MQFLGFAVLICLFQIFHYSFACNGYDVKLDSFENGPNNPTLVVQPNPTFKLDKNCRLYLNGTLELLKPVTSAELNLKAKKNGILTVLDVNNINLCELLSTSSYPYECPLTKKKYSDNFSSGLDLSSYQKYLAKLIGKITIDATIVTNKKEINTFCVKVEITRRI